MRTCWLMLVFDVAVVLVQLILSERARPSITRVCATLFAVATCRVGDNELIVVLFEVEFDIGQG